MMSGNTHVPEEHEMTPRRSTTKQPRETGELRRFTVCCEEQEEGSSPSCELPRLSMEGVPPG